MVTTRISISVANRYQGYRILTIHHDQGNSVMLGSMPHPGRDGAKYVVANISDKTAEYTEWYNGYYTDDLEKAGKEYVRRVTARIAA